MAIKQKIIVAFSGGVDSSVATLLLLKQGYDVEALFMKNWDEEDEEICTAAEDLLYAKRVAKQLNIKLHTVNFSSEYWNEVFVDFIAKYKQGLTPNPDTLCNQKIKFKAFLDYALEVLGATKIATGHYANITDNNLLQIAVDDTKDQTYFLYLLNKWQLSKSIFPLGNLYKKDVRKIAKKNNLFNADKKDSTGICFIGKRNFDDFLNKYISKKKGDIVDDNGNFIKHHHGFAFYTIGQRKGLEIGGGFGSSNKPWFVVDKDIKNNKIIVAQQGSPLFYHNVIIANNIYFINNEIDYNKIYQAKIRHRAKKEYCKISKFNDNLKIVFNNKQRAITPGQAIVFYDNDICFGGANIKERFNE